jgi:hypothetical protein
LFVSKEFVSYVLVVGVAVVSKITTFSAASSRSYVDLAFFATASAAASALYSPCLSSISSFLDAIAKSSQKDRSYSHSY